MLEAALQHEVTAQAGAQAQLNIFQAKLTEAVVELEKRCAGEQADGQGGWRTCKQCIVGWFMSPPIICGDDLLAVLLASQCAA